MLNKDTRERLAKAEKDLFWLKMDNKVVVKRNGRGESDQISLRMLVELIMEHLDIEIDHQSKKTTIRRRNV